MTAHPIRTLLNTSAACSAVVPGAELDELDRQLHATYDLPESDRRAIRTAVAKASRQVVSLKVDGEHGSARRLAADTAAQLIDRYDLGDYTPAPDPNTPTDPDGLARLARRHAGYPDDDGPPAAA